MLYAYLVTNRLHCRCYRISTDKEMVKTRLMKIFCLPCKQPLYSYRKGNPSGALIKCFDHNIKKDYTKVRGECPNCGSVFARYVSIQNKPCNKLIRGKYFVRGFSTSYSFLSTSQIDKNKYR